MYAFEILMVNDLQDLVVLFNPAGYPPTQVMGSQVRHRNRVRLRDSRGLDWIRVARRNSGTLES